MRKLLLCAALAAALLTGGLRANADGGYPEAAPSLDAPSDAALTLRDFAYFPDFQFNTDVVYGHELRFPDPEAVKRRFGEPSSLEEETFSTQMFYPFGWVYLERDDQAYSEIEVLIDTDVLEGPRGLRVGDSVEALLAAFHNESTGLPMRSDKEGEIGLYFVGSDDGMFFQYGYATYLGNDYLDGAYMGKKLVTIEYGMVNGQQKCTVSFEVGGGVISQIRWQVYAPMV